MKDEKPSIDTCGVNKDVGFAVIASSTEAYGSTVGYGVDLYLGHTKGKCAFVATEGTVKLDSLGSPCTYVMVGIIKENFAY